MDNKVGNNVPAAQVLAQLLAQVQQANEALIAFCITLSDDERASALRPLRGADPMIAKAAALCVKYGISVPHVPPQGMLADADLARQIRPFVDAYEVGRRMVTDTLTQAQSESWEAFLALYAAIVRAASHDPQLAAEAKELQEFMQAYASRKKKAPGAATVAAPKDPQKP